MQSGDYLREVGCALKKSESSNGKILVRRYEYIYIL